MRGDFFKLDDPNRWEDALLAIDHLAFVCDWREYDPFEAKVFNIMQQDAHTGQYKQTGIRISGREITRLLSLHGYHIEVGIRPEEELPEILPNGGIKSR